MGKDKKHHGFKGRHQKSYKKDNWRNQRNGRGDRGEERRQHPPPVHTQERKQNFVQKTSLREDQVAIIEFVSKTEGFTGVLKSRFSDFHVNEIDRSGKVLQLTDLNVPKADEDTLSADEVTAARSELSEVISAELWDKITALAAAKGNDANVEPIEITVTELDKDKRTQIHKVLKQLFEGKLVSTTINQQVDDKEEKLIKIMKPKGGKSETRQRWTFPGEYAHFLVHKENLDTSEVAAALAVRLNLRPSQVNYCGTKDKRAKTTQRFCIKRRTPAQITGAAKSLRNVHVGNFEFSNEVLKLGDLRGNRFRIAIRHITADEEQIGKSLQALRENGFINYFGLQRFGNSTEVPTYEVGVALLKSDYKSACELILKPRENDLPFMKQIREKWWKERNSAAAAAMFRNDKFIEKKLLDGLAQYGENDFAGALRKIPRNMLLLYPHAFQSLIFNRIASRRIKEFGLQPMEGDLVYRNKEELDEDTEAVVETAQLNEDEEEQVDIKEETPAANVATESIFKRKVKPLTADDLTSGNYTLFDVVLPLPGYDITYPTNAVGGWYEEILQEYGLSSEKLRHNVKTYAMAGAYRKMVIQPTEMSWEFQKYDDPNGTLIQSDWEMLRGQSKEKATEEEAGGKFKALVLDFCLPTSAYATMLLRELLKSDTSAAKQTELEQEELKKAKDKEIENENKEENVEEIKSEKRKLEEEDQSEEQELNGSEAKKAKANEEAQEEKEAEKTEES